MNARSAENMHFGGYFIEKKILNIVTTKQSLHHFCDEEIEKNSSLYNSQLSHDLPIRSKW